MISSRDFTAITTEKDKTEAQIELIERSLEVAYLEALASGTIQNPISIKGIKKSDLTSETVRLIEKEGYRVASHIIGQNPEEVRLIL